MAIVPYEIIDLTDGQFPTGVRVVRWVDLDANGTASAYSAPQYGGKAVQMLGTGNVTMKGSLIPTQSSITPIFGTLHKVDATDLVLTDTEPQQVLEDCYQIRPEAANTATTCDVYLMLTTTSRR